MKEAEFLDAVELCYHGVTDPEGFEALTSHLCRAIGADAGDIVTEHFLTGQVVTYGSEGFDPAYRAAYDEAYLGKNPWFDNLKTLPRDCFHTDAEERDDFWQSAYYHEWVRPQRLKHSVGAVIEAGPDRQTWAGFARRGEAGGFEAEVAQLNRILPHLRRALELRRQLGTKTTDCASLLAVIDMVDAAVMVLDGSGKVQFANSAAERTLARTQALRLSQSGRLIVVAGRQDAQLGAAIHRCLSIADDPGLAPPPPIIVGKANRDRLVLHALPVWTSADGTPCRRLVAVVVTPVERGRCLDVRAFAEAFGLTRTEARLAAAIGRGVSVATFARQQGISVGTARWHLKNVEQKTGTSRIDEVVAAVWEMQPPLLHPSHVGGARDAIPAPNSPLHGTEREKPDDPLIP